MTHYEQELLWLLDTCPVPSQDMSTDDVLRFLTDYYEWWTNVQETLDELYEIEEPESV